MRDSIFVSHRRSDAQSEATLLRVGLSAAFGTERVFHDIVSVPVGSVLPDELRTALGRARVVLVVIGPGWLTAADEFGRRRIDKPDDWVHIETLTALTSTGVTVIPVLIDPTRMPPAEELPADLTRLATLNAFVCRKDKWDLDLTDLAGQIGEQTGWPVDADLAGRASVPDEQAMSQTAHGSEIVQVAGVSNSSVQINRS